jgi:hypothetical protein
MSAKRVTWLIELDPDFPGPEQLLSSGEIESVLLEPSERPWDVRWPEVEPPFVAYGTMHTLLRLARHPTLGPSVFDHFPSLRCSAYYRKLYDLLRREAFIVPMSALRHVDLERHFGGAVFVRPETNFKLFPAGIIQTHEADRLLSLFPEHHDELVVISEVVEMGQEYRCFCRDGRVFCHSSYPQEPYHPAPPEVVAFAEQVAARLRGDVPSGMLSVDVSVSGAGLRLVEVGGVNSWGVYGADIRAFVAAMEAEAREVDEERNPG